MTDPAATVQIAEGFSLTNRWLLYASAMLAPAQFITGLDSDFPSNLGFLAYNWYTQIKWYQMVSGKSEEIHAVSLVLPHFNLLYALSYLGGISSGNLYMGLLLSLGTAGVTILNTAASWKAWAVHQPRGYGAYRFFFFGWRTLTKDWHRWLFLPWQITDTITALSLFISAMCLACLVQEECKKIVNIFKGWRCKFLVIPASAVLAFIWGWPLVLWTELIISRNHLESKTDMIAVWLFIAQVAAMLMPSFGFRLSGLKHVLGRRRSSPV
ncbi:hypothetical protein VTH06DRAFT_7062 [Thermothelomyces fergusii]